MTDVRIDVGSNNYSGALAGANRGTIIGSYATGEINGRNNIGGLVGAHLRSGWIINSYAGVDVTGNTAVGGLVGLADDTPNLIINSYATGSVSAVGFSGGFVGVQRRGEIRNSYATGNVMSTTDGTRAIGGFVGEKLNNTVIRNSYASGSVTGINQVGGFIGNLWQNETNGLIADSYSIGSVSASGPNIGGFLGNRFAGTDGRVQNSYWNTETSGLSNSERGSGLDTQQMQSPTAPDAASPTRYTGWSTDNWDFGTNRQYPRLKYARNPDSSGRRTCSDAGGDGLPVCGSLIAPKPSYDLNELSVSPGRFSPRLNFNGRLSDYRTHVVGVGADNTIRLIVGSQDAGARFRALRGEDNTALVSEFGAGELSEEIILEDGENHIVVELTPSDPSARKRRYNFRLSYRVPRTPIEINTLEDLDALRNNPTGTYRLTRNLDFEDASSYRTRRVNSDWTVDDFGAAGDDGWQPINNFTGTFDGNGFAISNLQIKVGDADTVAVGLFGTIGVRGTVKNLILNDADVRASNSAAVQVAALVGHNRGLVLNSGVIASIVEGVGNTRGGGNHNYIGGLVGRNGLGSNDIAYIGNSFVVDSEIRVNPAVANATHHIGGLVGRNFYAEIYNSFVQATTVAGYCHVGGLIGNQFGPSSTIKNSYADVTLASSTESCRIGARGKLLGLVNGGVIENSYATGSSPGVTNLLGAQISSRASGFPPLIFNDSYSDSGASAGDARGRTTMQLQMPTAAVGLYENWSDEIWDFGTESEYPRLKYTAGPFGNVCDVAGAPDCGTLISPPRSYAVSDPGPVDLVIEIDSLEDLYRIRNNPNARYLLTRSLDFLDNESYKDLVNKAAWTVDDFNDTLDQGWQPIDNFSGSLDGNGFVISNLQINRSNINQGLFGSITGIVRNLGLTDVNINIEGTNIGALVGANRGTVIGSYAIGEVAGTDHVGGLVGAHLASGWIINSYAAVDVTGNTSVGGLVGIAEGTTPNLVINSYATGSVSAEGLSGGFIGLFSSGEIINSYATGRVRVTDVTTNEHVGGFVGEKSDNAVIRNSYATGAIAAGDASDVGGFAGLSSGANTISDSYAIGNVSAIGSAIGGLIGSGSGTARNSYWDTQTSGRATSAAGSGLTTEEMQSPTAANATSPPRYTRLELRRLGFRHR